MLRADSLGAMTTTDIIRDYLNDSQGGVLVEEGVGQNHQSQPLSSENRSITDLSISKIPKAIMHFHKSDCE
jgi:hypothetical protein